MPIAMIPGEWGLIPGAHWHGYTELAPRRRHVLPGRALQFDKLDGVEFVTLAHPVHVAEWISAAVRSQRHRLHLWYKSDTTRWFEYDDPSGSLGELEGITTRAATNGDSVTVEVFTATHHYGVHARIVSDNPALGNDMYCHGCASAGDLGRPKLGERGRGDCVFGTGRVSI